MGTFHSRQRRLLGSKWIRALIITAVLIAALYFSARLVGSKIIESYMKGYTPFNDNSLIARLVVTPTNTNHKWKVQVSTSDSSGTQAVSTQIFLESCDHWLLKANIISISPWLALAVPSGWYMLTELDGSHCYDQHGKPTTSIKKIMINSSATSVPVGHFLNLVRSIPVASASIHPDGITYNVIITPTSLSVKPKS